MQYRVISYCDISRVCSTATLKHFYLLTPPPPPGEGYCRYSLYCTLFIRLLVPLVSFSTLWTTIIHDPYSESLCLFTNLNRVEFRFAPSLLETALLYNDVCHWLGASLISGLINIMTMITSVFCNFPFPYSDLSSLCVLINNLQHLTAYLMAGISLPEFHSRHSFLWLAGANASVMFPWLPWRPDEFVRLVHSSL